MRVARLTRVPRVTRRARVTRMTGVRGCGERRDAGSATILVLAGVLVLAFVLAVALTRSLAVLGRHRVEGAADLAALAAAGAIGTTAAPCERAAVIAARNGADVVSCRIDLGADGRSGTVRVRVSARVGLPLVGTQQVDASARAGRLPAAGRGHEPVTWSSPATGA